MDSLQAIILDLKILLTKIEKKNHQEHRYKEEMKPSHQTFQISKGLLEAMKTVLQFPICNHNAAHQHLTKI